VTDCVSGARAWCYDIKTARGRGQSEQVAVINGSTSLCSFVSSSFSFSTLSEASDHRLTTLAQNASSMEER
jgi:hypothetical protein